MWYNICQCGHDVRGDNRQLIALCDNPNPAKVHQVKRPNSNLDQKRTPEATRIYRLLEHNSLQAFEAIGSNGTNCRDVFTHISSSKPAPSSWNKPKATSLTNKLQNGKQAYLDPDISPLYWQVISDILDRKKDLVALKDALWTFYSNIVPEERFIFEVRRRELEVALVDCIDWLSSFYHQDDSAHGWRVALHEICKIEDEGRLLSCATDLFQHDIDRLQWSELRDIDVLLQGRKSKLNQRINDSRAGGTKIVLEQGERVLQTFFQQSATVMRWVEMNISTPGGAPDLHWFREQRSGRIRFTTGRYPW